MLKTIFFSIYSLISNLSFYLVIALTLISLNFLAATLRKKFILFILVVIAFSIWGFIFDLDGIFLVFLTAEFTIFLLLLMTYLQLYSNYTFLSPQISYYLSIPILFYFFVFNHSNSFYTYTSFYKALNHFVSSDFFILYYFLFEKMPILVIFLTLIISFFSLFFIIMYFSLKLTKLKSQKASKSLHFLRKQLLTKQANFSSKLYTFQR